MGNADEYLPMNRYRTYRQFCEEKFGGPILKLPIDAGFTCPNRDGSIGHNGCTYCINSAFTPRYCSAEKSVGQQIEEGIRFHQQRRRESEQYLAYFQSFSNTYASLEQLKSIYAEALTHPQVKGIVIGTRPDCVDEEKLDYLAQLNQQCFVSIEYGVESCYDNTLRRIHRGLDFACAQNAINETARRGIHTGAHFIIGLPGENPKDWLNGIDIINQLPINSIKFHQLQILKGSQMEQEFQEKRADFYTFSMDSYIDFMVEIIEKIRADIVIERFAAEVPPRYLSTNPWNLQRYDVILQKIRQKLEEKDSWQGIKLH